MEAIKAQVAEPTVSNGVVERVANIKLDAADYEAILGTKQDFSMVATFMLQQYAKGGVMVPANRVQYLSDVTGMPIRNAGDLSEIVENSIKRHNPTGTLTVTIDVDPAFAPGLEEMANAQGRTVNDIVQESLGIVLTNSWIYSLDLSGGLIPLLQEQRSELERIMGCAPITSEKLLDWARSTSGPRREESKEVKVPEKRMGKVKAWVAEKMDELEATR